MADFARQPDVFICYASVLRRSGAVPCGQARTRGDHRLDRPGRIRRRRSTTPRSSMTPSRARRLCSSAPRQRHSCRVTSSRSCRSLALRKAVPVTPPGPCNHPRRARLLVGRLPVDRGARSSGSAGWPTWPKPWTARDHRPAVSTGPVAGAPRRRPLVVGREREQDALRQHLDDISPVEAG